MNHYDLIIAHLVSEWRLRWLPVLATRFIRRYER
jgi:hypothetical protein